MQHVFWSRAGVLKAVFAAAVDGATVLDLCKLGDQMMLEETRNVYKKEKDMKKGENSDDVAH